MSVSHKLHSAFYMTNVTNKLDMRWTHAHLLKTSFYNNKTMPNSFYIDNVTLLIKANYDFIVSVCMQCMSVSC